MTDSRRPADEDELVGWLRRRTERQGGRWIGDDAAVLPESERWAVTMDSQIEGVHFLPGWQPAWIARRLLAVNLSDLAAMGAEPSYAFLALAAPDEFDHQGFLAAFADACSAAHLELAGGDLAHQSHVAAVATLLGRRPEGGRWLRRAEARAGEALWLGGTVGEAAAGLRLLELGAGLEGDVIHLPEALDLPPSLLELAGRCIRRHRLPSAQLELGSWLGSRAVGAAIDVSDGLARDLHRLCSESGVGAELELEGLPLAAGWRELAAALGGDWKRWALGGGEDYVLLFTLPPDQEPPGDLGCYRVGKIVEEKNVVLVSEGEKTTLPAYGWDHLATARSSR